ncbi:hypothetical protein [Actinomyces haliotis]|uniref:hypothetical protein n=1 Tax=Actinomyces haliotis TaxID=1280843 RepID=UPI00188EDC78|nr:hypothetical protein [Actinomyces haliotis]
MDEMDAARAAADTTDPVQGLRAVATLRRLTEELELRQVEAALRSGMSWAQVAAALGVTRQAVHKRFARRVDPALARHRTGDRP